MNLDNRNLFVTGASSGIGRQICISLSETANLWITGRNVDNLAQTKKLCVTGKEVTSFNIDLTNFDNISALVNDLPELDGVVLNAGVIDYAPVKLISGKRIRDIFSINFECNVLLIQQMLQKKRIKKGASIVFISSVSSLVGVAGTSLYAASKAALTAFSRVLASELASKAIRVNTISPGIINTEMIGENNQLTDNTKMKMVADYPLGLGTPSDVANQVVYLMSDNSKWMTGTNIILDGGYSLR